MSCGCMGCILDSYLHVFIREITECSLKGDVNLTGSIDAFIRIKYDGYKQDTKILKNETKSMSFKEPLILENAEPPTKEELQEDTENEKKLVFEIWDADSITADDLLATAVMEVPMEFGVNVGETTLDLMDKEGKVVGKLTIDQLHFIKQKLRRYNGPCKCCCFCMASGERA